MKDSEKIKKLAEAILERSKYGFLCPATRAELEKMVKE